jgi:glutamine synthetase
MKDDLFELLKAAEVKFVRVLWCDNASVIRSKAMHVRVVEEYMEHGVGISNAQMAIPVMYDGLAPDSGLGPVGEIRLVPDWATLNALPYAPGHVRVMGDMMLDGRPWAVCPRDFLKRQIAAAEEVGLEIRGAFENEFYLMRAEGEQLLPADESVFAATLAMDASAAVINDITDALQHQDIAVELYYPESGPGQQEISIRYGPALAAADRQIAFRETVRAVAMRHGLKASFLPKIFSDKAGSGCHLHLSIWRESVNVFRGDGPHGLSEEGAAFMAGVLDHLPALMAVTTPTPNSYRRLQPHAWAGAFRCWGVDNREAAVRLPSHPSGRPTNFELKTVDASSNPYLALGAVIACGLDGVRLKRKLPSPVGVDPGTLTEKERAALHAPRLPRSLDEALKALRKDETLLGAMGAPLAQAFTAVRKAEWEALHGLSLEDEVSLLLERY